jgi:hypothetical protein
LGGDVADGAAGVLDPSSHESAEPSWLSVVAGESNGHEIGQLWPPRRVKFPGTDPGTARRLVSCRWGLMTW